MSKNKRKQYSSQFKAKVAIEAVKGEKTIAEIASQYSGFCRKLFKVTSKQCQSSCLKRSLQRVLR